MGERNGDEGADQGELYLFAEIWDFINYFSEGGENFRSYRVLRFCRNAKLVGRVRFPYVSERRRKYLENKPCDLSVLVCMYSI